jgi:predicted transcriptional regulator
MPRTKKRLEEEELKAVYDAIEEHISEKHKFCSITEIVEITNFSKSKCNSILDELIKKGVVYKAFESQGNPTIYMPTYMMQEVLRMQSRPKWVENYAFEEKKEILKQIDKTREELSKFEMLEGLLYGTGIPLEESVVEALKFLQFEDVKHHKNEDVHDISFTYGSKKYLLEIEGTKKQGNKKKILQLDGWRREELDRGADPDDIVCIFVANAFRETPPSERDSPLTQHAINYLKSYKFRFFTTPFLFDLVKKVYNKEINEFQAQESVIKGEKYE